MIQRKQFELIAGTIKVCRDLHHTMGNPIGAEAITALAKDMAKTLRTTNPKFDETKFLKACGVSNK